MWLIDINGQNHLLYSHLILKILWQLANHWMQLDSRKYQKGVTVLRSSIIKMWFPGTIFTSCLQLLSHNFLLYYFMPFDHFLIWSNQQLLWVTTRVTRHPAKRGHALLLVLISFIWQCSFKIKYGLTFLNIFFSKKVDYFNSSIHSNYILWSYKLSAFFLFVSPQS